MRLAAWLAVTAFSVTNLECSAQWRFRRQAYPPNPAPFQPRVEDYNLPPFYQVIFRICFVADPVWLEILVRDSRRRFDQSSHARCQKSFCRTFGYLKEKNERKLRFRFAMTRLYRHLLRRLAS
ncbi:unnamed protein product [Nippostrongylus brasiliensis]|uniref:Secreted protein n=1 Tax=Nippostrongylus brasiliensis TaxID=27835 RepID=A0A0N4YY22_NIPBR|nr:unnamed protein product [Nippostrongylus brasiliensis]